MPMISTGWGLYYFRIFKAALDELEAAVTQLAQDDPKGYKTHPKTKLLASVYKAITEVVPANPDAPECRPGRTLGVDNTNWRRVKSSLQNPNRLFYRFSSRPAKVIIYVWFNEDGTELKSDSKTDIYGSFVSMLARGLVPGKIDELLKVTSNFKKINKQSDYELQTN
jgi:toxin YhaV